jgi:hypothetical protein
LSFDRIVEAIIQEATARGEFENLAGQGKPVDLTDYFNTPEDVRVAGAMLKNAGVLPVELELLQEIMALKELVISATEEEHRAAYRKILKDKQLQFNILMERSRQNTKKK